MSARPPPEVEAHRRQQEMQREVPTFVAILSAAVAVVVFVLVFMLYTLGIGGPLIEGIQPMVSSVGGTSASDMVGWFGNAVALMAVSVLAIPGAVLLMLLMGGRGGMASRFRRRPPRPPGGPNQRF